MTTLMKRRRRNRLAPWTNTLLTPWSNESILPFKSRLFSSPLSDLQNSLNIDNFFTDDFFDDFGQMPAMNVKEHKDDFEIEFAAPGFSKKDFEVVIEDEILQVCGEKSEKEEQKDEGYSRKEFNYTTFKRSLPLPESIDLDQEVKATYKNGVLKINLLKIENVIEESPKKVIEVS